MGKLDNERNKNNTAGRDGFKTNFGRKFKTYENSISFELIDPDGYGIHIAENKQLKAKVEELEIEKSWWNSPDMMGRW